MDKTLLTFVADQILEKVGSYANEDIARPRQLKNHLQKLGQFTEILRAKLEDPGYNEAEAFRNFLVKLQNVVYYIEDGFDKLSYEILHRKFIKQQPMLRRRLRDFASPILFRMKMASNLKKIKQSIHDAERQAIREFGEALTKNKQSIREIGFGEALPVVSSISEEEVYFFSSSVIGRDRDVATILHMLQLSSSTPSLVTVVSIVGLGGSGKTTLAQMIFYRVKMLKLFDEILWVFVSDTSDVEYILKTMLDALDKTASGLNNFDAILRRLESKLKDKRFLLVLDDAWEGDCAQRNMLKAHLLTICGRAGNFIIETTRRMNLAMDKEHVVPLELLPNAACWEIIRMKCVLHWGGSMPRQLEGVGRKIAGKCRGLPLVAKVVGGILCQKRTEEEWLSILNSDEWNEAPEFLPVLKLSFRQLHSFIKQCFVYCSLFPKYFEYDKEKLIQLWMAEGFLNTGKSVKSMEEVGDDYFNSLIAHSYFEEVQIDNLGNITSCKMPTQLHDLASSFSNYSSLKLEDESRCFIRTSNHQHLSVDEVFEKGESRNVRSFICKADFSHLYYSGRTDVSHPFCTFKSLRSLDLSYAGLKELPSVVGKLQQLRYLDISYNRDIKELPNFITMLYNLQTLRLIMCFRIEMLPANMINLVRLRHIHFDNPYLKIFSVGCLTELQTLPHFEVREDKGFGIVELKRLNGLRGKLSITSLQNVINKDEAKEANLKEKKLTDLCLEWERSSDVSNCNDKDVLEGLQPPPVIKRLTINGYSGNKFPNWMSMGINGHQCQFNQLVELSLSYCRECEKMPSLGHLPRLKILDLSGFDNIKSMGSEFYGECEKEVNLFPELRKFSLRDMKSLKEWAAVVVEDGASVQLFPVLTELSIEDCPRLTSIPLRHLSSLTRLSIARCEDMKNLSNDSQRLPCLNQLVVRRCRNLVSLSSLQDVKWLLKLRIEGCVGLTSLPQGLVSLDTLEIHSCGLSSLENLGFIKNLRELGLGPFSGELEDFPALNSFNLSRVEKLALCGWPKLKSLPQEVPDLSALKKLSLVDFKGLETLPEWLDKLSSLKQLILVGCDNLKIIPKTKLTMLECYRCPLLKERYNKYTGLNRRDISHIAYTYFD